MLVVRASHVQKFPLQTQIAPHCVDAGGCTSVACPTIYLTNTEIGTACGSKCCSEAADAMASNEDSVRQERLRRRDQGL